MRKQLAMFVLAMLMAGSNAIAQTFSGAEASKKIPEASVLTFKKGESAPSYIQLSDHSNVLVAQFGKWINGTLNLGNNNSFNRIHADKDELGFTHHTFQYYYNGYPVEGVVYKVHEKNGKIYSVNGNVEVIKNVSIANTLSEKEALAAALKNINAHTYMWESKDAEKLLQRELENTSATYYPKGAKVLVKDLEKNEYVLAYKFDIYAADPLQRFDIFVNTASGKIVGKNNKIHSECFNHKHKHHFHPDDVTDKTSTTVNATGTAVTKYSGTKTITTDNFGGSYRLRETGRGSGIETYNLQNGDSYAAAVDFTDSDNIWNSTVDNAAYDAHWGAEVTYDYYMTVHSRNSYNNAGAKMLSYVHYGTAYDNAFWDGSRMTYGDGSNTPGRFKALTSLDVVGHEFTHGVTGNSAGLVYSGESGALNESFSDIFGTVIEHAGKPGTANFLIGEEVMYSGGALRSMSNPNLYDQPDTYQGSMWDPMQEVHTNSGVGNFWFYLLCQGGSGTNDNSAAYSVTSIGMTKAAAIAYRSLTVYLTPNSTYADAREASISAAADLYGACGQEVQSVTNAWHAVGVGAVYTNVVNAEFTASVTEFCSLPAQVTFINQSTNASTVLWTFGDGTTSTAKNPVHSYTANGSYSVTLSVNGGACGGGTDAITKTNFIVVNTNGPCPATIPASGTGTIQTACSGTLLDEGGMEDYHNSIDGSITISPTNALTVTLSFSQFNTEGGYDYVYVYDGPTISSPLLGQYSGTTLPTSISSTGPSITVRQTSDGSVIRSGFVSTWSCTQITSTPVVNFSADKVETCNGVINFTDLSTQGASSWTWNFGDGTTSNVKNPTHQYTAAGVYTVSLIACNGLGCGTVHTKTNYIDVNIGEPACSLVSIPESGSDQSTACSGTLYDSGGNLDYQDGVDGTFTISPAGASKVTLTFTQFSFESGYDYLYIYDGPSTSSTLIGTYSGTSSPGTIVSSGGSITLHQTTDGSVVRSGFVCNWQCSYPTIPTALFVAAPLISCDGVVSFYDQSTDDPTSWLWNFGDGTTSTLQHPQHTYSSNGQYTVSLVACNGIGCSTAGIKTNYITVSIGSGNCSLVVVPASGTAPTNTACTGVLYDSGGNGDYSNGTYGQITIAPTGGTSVVLSFLSFNMESNFDYLWIYDGASTSSPLIGSYTGTSLPNGGTITSTGNALTLVQQTDGSVIRSGFVINWSCATSTQNSTLENVAVSIYPNPANNELNMHYAFDGARTLKVNMYNALGTSVFEDAGIFTGGYDKLLDVKSFTKGLYTVTISDEEGARLTNKVVVE